MSKKPTTLSAAPGGVSPNRRTSDEPTSALEVVAPGKLSEDAQMGQQLTEQYRKAVGGMTEVLRFGAMMMGLRAELSTRGKLSKGGPAKDGNGGITGWLEQFAPDIKRSTAERFLHVAEAVAADFALPAKVSFIELATSAPEQLSGALREKQDELWDFVNGTSQRSWLDRFAPPAPKVINSPAKPVLGKTPEEIETMHREEVTAVFAATYDAIHKKEWHYLQDQLIRGAIDMFSEFITEAKAHLAIPKSERVARKIKAISNK